MILKSYYYISGYNAHYGTNMVLDDFHCKSIQYDKLFLSEMGYIDYHYWKASGPYTYKERLRTCIDGIYALEPLLGNSN